MDLPPAWSQTCPCGRTFSLPQAYTCHKRSCEKTKKRLSGALEKAKNVWRAKKRQKLDELAANEVLAGSSNMNVIPVSSPTDSVPTPLAQNVTVSSYSSIFRCYIEYSIFNQSTVSSVLMDIDRSLAERRVRREHRQLPKRYRDILPDPPAALPPLPQSPQPPRMEPVVSSPVLSPVRKMLKSTRNAFGLFRQYHATHFPEHDPDENLTLEDLMDTNTGTPPEPPMDSYHPYPNRSSFLLGEWYWNDGTKKSQSSFKNLVEVVGDPAFRPEDVAATNWKRIDAQLGGEPRDDGDEGEGSWEDEAVDGDWVETSIKIKVPFHKRTLHPGQEEFEAGVLYHRKLVSVIREKISSPSSFPHLHLEPFELYCQPNGTAEPVRVHGELYSSTAFIDAHRDLQSSPKEPGCDLPRVIVALMFASDGTQLTAFSSAKLWPLYLGIGNESKYRRTKPSCRAFEHIAYFESVSKAHWLHVMEIHGFYLIAPRCL